MKRKKWIGKLKYIFALILLIAGGFLLPQFFFAIQDKGDMKDIGKGSRMGINLTALEENYESSRYERLSKYAEGCAKGKDYYVSEMAFDLNVEEQEKVLSDLLNQNSNMIWLVNDARYALGNVYPFPGLDDFAGNITNMKKYVIYDAENVAFLCWYVELFFPPRNTMNFLIDAEDGTLYYVQYNEYAVNTKYLETAQQQLVATDKGMSADYVLNMETLAALWTFCTIDYNADWEGLYIASGNGWETRMSEYEAIVMESLDAKAREQKMEKDDLLVEMMLKDLNMGEHSVWFPLHYGDYSLTVRGIYDWGSKTGNFENPDSTTLVIMEIAGQIPDIK